VTEKIVKIVILKITNISLDNFLKEYI